MTPEELPAYSDLILPTVRAVITLGGSATAREVTSQVLTDLAPSEEMLAVVRPTRPEASVYMERVQWARSYAKLIGALESPRRGVFLVTPVQVKRYDPNGRSVGRETVALFQRDAQTKGAERAILVTLGKFSEPARRAAIVTAPTVDLIDGDRLAALVKEQKLGVRSVTRVDPDWFNRFD